MSVFTVLKYPISTPPKPEEVFALPAEIIREWMGGEVEETTLINFLYSMEAWYRSPSEQSRGAMIDKTENLRRLIREYEE